MAENGSKTDLAQKWISFFDGLDSFKWVWKGDKKGMKYKLWTRKKIPDGV